MNIGQFIIDILRLKYFRKKAYATNNVTINLNESNICEIKDINFLTNVVISEGGGETECNKVKIAENCQINNSNIFISGKNNEVIIEKNSVINFLNLSIVGDNNRVFIDENFCAATSFCLTIGNLPNIFAKNTSVEIGSNTCIRSLFCVLYENSSFLKIGKDCMFSDNIEIWGTDTHSVLDLDGNILNKAKGVEIGNHVWIGKDVKIGKAAKISDDSIVSFGSVVYSKFNDKNIVIAGNPANIKRRNITWCRETPENYKRLREERKIKCQKLNCQIMLQED